MVGPEVVPLSGVHCMSESAQLSSSFFLSFFPSFILRRRATAVARLLSSQLFGAIVFQKTNSKNHAVKKQETLTSVVVRVFNVNIIIIIIITSFECVTKMSSAALQQRQPREQQHQRCSSAKEEEPLITSLTSPSGIKILGRDADEDDDNAIIVEKELVDEDDEDKGKNGEDVKKPSLQERRRGPRKGVRLQTPTPQQSQEDFLLSSECETLTTPGSAPPPPTTIASGVFSAVNIVKKVSARVSTKKQGKKEEQTTRATLHGNEQYVQIFIPKNIFK